MLTPTQITSVLNGAPENPDMIRSANIAKVLIRAAELVEAGWTRGCLARGKNGHRIGVYDRRAARFSLNGAVLRASADLNVSYYVVQHTITSEKRNTVAWNDSLPPGSGKTVGAFLRSLAEKSR